jgi:hypothetical protein
MPKRSEEIFCPKCKARGYRIFTLGKEDKVKYQCKQCKYEWTQNKLLSFMDNTTSKDDPLICKCGGKYELNRLHGATMRRMLKCNKCAHEKLE